jgi:hypothetical protein
MPRVQQIDIEAIEEFARERREAAERIQREREYELELLERIANAVERLERRNACVDVSLPSG